MIELLIIEIDIGACWRIFYGFGYWVLVSGFGIRIWMYALVWDFIYGHVFQKGVIVWVIV